MRADITGDGVVTISDVWGWAEFIGCWPGNFIFRWLSGSSVGRFFEISQFDQYTAGAWVVSVIVWLAALSALASTPRN